MAIVLSGSTNDITVNGVSVATDTEVSTSLAGKANNADLKEIGVGQTWQDVTGSRTAGVTYTNTTGKPIGISLVTYGHSGSYSEIEVDGMIVTRQLYYSGSTEYKALNVIVPNGSTYRLSQSVTIYLWSELR